MAIRHTIRQTIKNNHIDSTILDLSKDTLTLDDLTELENLLAENTAAGRIIWGKLPTHAENKLEKINYYLQRNNLAYTERPSSYVHALLSYHVYEDDTKKSEKVKITFSNKKTITLDDWEVLDTFRNDENGYFGVAYKNNRTHCVVLAHRGTEATITDVHADVQGIIKNQITAQQASAFSFTHRIVERAKALNYRLSITGHSLGGWHAQLSLFFCHETFKYNNVSAVTFDSPGALQSLKCLLPTTNAEDISSLTQLDITIYLSAPHPINTCNKHLGQIYRVYPTVAPLSVWQSYLKSAANFAGSSLVEQLWALQLHSLEIILETFDPVSGDPKRYKQVKNWPHTSVANKGNEDVIRQGVETIMGIFPGGGNTIATTVIGSLINLGIPESVHGLANTLADVITGKFEKSQLDAFSKYAEKLNDYDQDEQLSIDQKFHTYFVAKYQTETVDAYQKFLIPQSEVTWFLHKLEEHHNSKELEPAIRELASRYTLTRDNKVFMVTVRSQTANQLYNQLLRIRQLYPELKEWLQQPQQTILNTQPSPLLQQSHSLPFIPKTSLPFYLPPRIPVFMGRIKELAQLEASFAKNGVEVYQTITGIEGSGKTQLAIEYAYQAYEKQQYSIIWLLDAKSESSLQLNLRLLADAMALNIREGITIKEQLPLFYHHLASYKQPTLLILEGVEDNYFKEYLPLQAQGIKVLITTYNQHLGNAHTLRLASLSSDEAVDYIRRTFVYAGRIASFKRDDAIKLATALYNFPLSLSQAMSFVHTHGITSSNYLTRYQLIPVSDNTMTLTQQSAQRAWQLSLKAVLNESVRAYSLLQFCAYLSPEYIPIVLLEAWMENPLEADVAITLLKRHSLLITLDEEQAVQTYPLLQELLRLKLEKNASKTAEKDKSDKITKGKIITRGIEIFSRLVLDAEHMPKKVLQDQLKWLLPADSFFSYEQPQSDTITTLENLGYLWSNLGDDDQAKKYYEQALMMYKKIEGSKLQPNIVVILHNLGMVWSRLGDSIKARKYYEQALALYKQLDSDQSQISVTSTLVNLGNSWESLGDYTKAKECYEQSLTIHKKVHGSKPHANIALALTNLGDIWRNLKDNFKAKDHYEEALEIYKEVHDDESQLNMAITLNNLGGIWKKLGDNTKAQKFCEQALTTYRKFYDDKHPEIIRILTNLEKIKSLSRDFTIQNNAGLPEGNAFSKEEKTFFELMNNDHLIHSNISGNTSPQVNSNANFLSAQSICQKSHFDNKKTVSIILRENHSHLNQEYFDTDHQNDISKQAEYDLDNQVYDGNLISSKKGRSESSTGFYEDAHHQTSTASKNTLQWFSPAGTFSIMRAGYQIIRDIFITEPKIDSIKKRITQEGLENRQDENKLTIQVPLRTKEIASCPPMVLKQHAFPVNNKPLELNSIPEKTTRDNIITQQLPFNEQLIAGRYIAHYARKNWFFTLPWNRKHVLSPSEKNCLDNHRKILQRLEETIVSQKASRTGRSGLFNDKFNWIDKTLLALTREIHKISTSHQITDSISWSIQQRINRIEEMIHKIAQQNIHLKKFSVQEQRLKRHNRGTGKQNIVENHCNLITGELSQLVTANLSNSDDNAFSDNGTIWKSIPFFSENQQFWPTQNKNSQLLPINSSNRGHEISHYISIN